MYLSSHITEDYITNENNRSLIACYCCQMSRVGLFDNGKCLTIPIIVSTTIGEQSLNRNSFPLEIKYDLIGLGWFELVWVGLNWFELENCIFQQEINRRPTHSNWKSNWTELEIVGFKLVRNRFSKLKLTLSN